MEHEAFAEALAELGHPTRLSVFRRLARHAPCGVPATEIADALGVAPNTLSPHLDMLTRTGLIGRERRGRSLLYRLDVEGAGALVDYLAGDCCHGRPDVCAPPQARAPDPNPPGQHSAQSANPPPHALFIRPGPFATSTLPHATISRTPA